MSKGSLARKPRYAKSINTEKHIRVLLKALTFIANEPRDDAANWMRGVARSAIVKVKGRSA